MLLVSSLVQRCCQPALSAGLVPFLLFLDNCVIFAVVVVVDEVVEEEDDDGMWWGVAVLLRLRVVGEFT